MKNLSLAVYVASVGETINACTIHVREPQLKKGWKKMLKCVGCKYMNVI
jgi:hypothetical protein